MNLKDIKELIEMLKESDITDLQIEKDEYKVRLKREKIMASFELPRVAQSAAAPSAMPAVAPAAQPAQTAQEEHDAQGLVTVTAPLVGTFYASSTPESDPFVSVGDRVKKGQVICIVEAMKLMNEIESEVDGVLVKCLVDNSQPVEYGEPLFLVEPN